MTKLSYLASPKATQETLGAFGLATKKALGQNFLINDAILHKICDLAELESTDYVLEVGPGIGTLSLALLTKAGRLVSVERDKDLPQVLAQTTQDFAGKFYLISKDALDLSLKDLQANPLVEAGELPHKFVANLPYAVAATLVLQYFQNFDFIESATVMVQSEVADRMCARKGTKNYGAYTVKLSLFTEYGGRFQVSPNNFFPPPRVESSVIRLNRRSEGRAAELSREEQQAVCAMADAAFASRRKTILNSMKQSFAAQGIALEAAKVLERAGIDPKRRGETLDLDEFIDLGLAYLELTCARQ